MWEAPTGTGDAPAGFQDADQVSESGSTQAAESDAETCPASITVDSSSTTDGAETAAGSPSECEAYREEIIRKLEQGLTAQRIWQDLMDERGFAAKYHSVRRYVSKPQNKTPQLVRRMEVAAGEEARIDFGTGTWITTTDAVTGQSKQRRTWMFRIVLSHSRKGYNEAVFHQSTEAFIGALGNSFRYVGGTPNTLVIDNLMAAVIRFGQPLLHQEPSAPCRIEHPYNVSQRNSQEPIVRVFG
ncbi:MAG: hypothetical protein WKF77_10380 [Planctomycetaceae bacterium]